jgi:O-acetylhomoserine/O-acetylserine sulfhydrylase-like pyridoxal-dependent enzyme
MLKCIILPRQARDKHTENTQKRDHWISNASLGMGVASKRAALEAAVANLTSGGDKHVHLVQGHELYGADAAVRSTPCCAMLYQT